MYIEDIDYDAALRTVGGNEDLLVQVFSLFAKTAPDKADRLKQFEVAEDAENYTIAVHALKSSARSVGALELAEQAYFMERKGQMRDIAAIHKGTDELLVYYLELARRIKNVVG